MYKLSAWNVSHSAAQMHNYVHLCERKHPEHHSDTEEVSTQRTRPQNSFATEKKQNWRAKRKQPKHARIYSGQTNAGRQTFDFQTLEDTIQSIGVTGKVTLQIYKHVS